MHRTHSLKSRVRFDSPCLSLKPTLAGIPAAPYLANKVFDSEKSPKRERLDAQLERELYALCGRIYDGVQTSIEMERFNRLLDESEHARQLYLKYVRLNCHLMMHTGTDLSQRIDELRQYVSNAAGAEAAPTRDAAEKNDEVQVGASSGTVAGAVLLRSGAWVGVAIAASLALIACGVILGSGSDGPLEAARDGSVVHDRPRIDVEVVPQVAELTYVSRATRWTTDGESLSSSTALKSGDSVAFSRGQVELTYSSGTRLLLIGPADFELTDVGGYLKRGGLVASVTEEGHGFTVKTPNGKVVDLGTEFGVAVDDFGVSEVSVFEGAVEAYPYENDDRAERKLDLSEGRGLLWDSKSLISLKADLNSFASSALLRLPTQPLQEQKSSNELRYNGGSLEGDRWSPLGALGTSDRGLQLKGGPQSDHPPYLVTNREFDPSSGAVTVTCDFHFEGAGPHEDDVFAILTRSTNNRGIALPPWNGSLAAGVRCSFESSQDGERGVGLLRAGVKMESSRELNSIVQRGFLAPEASTSYRAVVVDDGVNVSMTVSERDNPSQSVSMTFRSLFRGGSNHVAFEGCRNGITIIERIEVSQEARTRFPPTYNGLSQSLRDAERRIRTDEELLASLAPRESELVSESKFDGSELDKESWRVLGHAALRDGMLQLGDPNEQGHIDTWRPRPYLLTRDTFDPHDGILTVVGRVTFAENFLTGFGATFGVMTRCGETYGSGPEWEQSVLNRGLRATFWPSAWDRERRLEIYERGVEDRMQLLATRGADVDPDQRSYLFQLIDDGETIQLSMLDPNRPDPPFRITATSRANFRPGPIAFESCWGSPILLDDIRIYQSPKGQKRPAVAHTDEPAADAADGRLD